MPSFDVKNLMNEARFEGARQGGDFQAMVQIQDGCAPPRATTARGDQGITISRWPAILCKRTTPWCDAREKWLTV